MHTNDLGEILAGVRAKRGYLLPHHGLMAVSDPALLEAYDALYSNLTLRERQLGNYAHEYVWLAVLIAREESLGTHHVARFLDAGGSHDDLSRILAITALVTGSRAHRFVAESWSAHLPGFDVRQSYLATFRETAGDGGLSLAHLCATAVLACIGDWALLEWQIAAAYADGVDEAELAEALSLMMFPGGVPHYVKAARVWQSLILSGEVDASEGFRAWARLSGQGGYDEAAGITT